MAKLTSNDIAKLAGVSRSTVSRVINGYTNVPETTRKKVMKVIKEHNYYPHLSGQLLTGKKTRTIGLFWAGQAIAGDTLTSSYFMEVVDAATNRDYLILSCVLDNFTDKKNMNHVRKIFQEGRIDAGIFVGVSNNEPIIDQLLDLDKIVGIFDYLKSDQSNNNLITVNFEKDSGEKAIDYLTALGHKKIAVIDGDLSRMSCLHRHESYLKGFKKHNLPINHKWMAYGGIVKETGREVAYNMLSNCLDDLPTAICANNDSVAFGVMEACDRLNIKVPEDISIIGCDGHMNGLYTKPPLTTLTFDFKDMFTSLVNRVVDRIEGGEILDSTYFISSQLIERESCRKINGFK